MLGVCWGDGAADEVIRLIPDFEPLIIMMNMITLIYHSHQVLSLLSAVRSCSCALLGNENKFIKEIFSMSKKKKLMVVLGAGASIELGMPSVNDIDDLFNKWSLKQYGLANDKSQSLYGYIRDEIKRYYSLNPKSGSIKETNFEEILYVILQLSAILGDEDYKQPMNSFWGLRKLPKIRLERSEKKFEKSEKNVDGDVLWNLCSSLIDELLKEIRNRCKGVKLSKLDEFKCFKCFINQLHSDYDVAFISINYDNLITQACPELFTGFDASGEFIPSDVYNRSEWGLLYHLHGSVHFDMRGDEDESESDIHKIKWNSDLNSAFKVNSLGRNTQNTSEGLEMLTSVIVVGYGKTNQIQRAPFRIYYAQLDKIVERSEAVLFLGYGFNDLHLNNCFYSIRKGNFKKPVVVIDYADKKHPPSPLQFRYDTWSYNLKTMPFFNDNEMGTDKGNSPPYIPKIIENREFEISTNLYNPFAVWYGGFLEACRNYSKIKEKLG